MVLLCFVWGCPLLAHFFLSFLPSFPFFPFTVYIISISTFDTIPIPSASVYFVLFHTGGQLEPNKAKGEKPGPSSSQHNKE